MHDRATGVADLVVATPAWHAAHPGAVVGVLAVQGVVNPASHPGLDRVKDELEMDLRARYGDLERPALREVGVLPAYAAYYKRFGQRYHVAMQLESVAQKGKSLPRVAALVEAMFVAELRNQILTAGHDLDALVSPVRIDTGTGADGERYLAPNDNETAVKPGDMYVADARGVLSAIVTGPAAYARIGPETTAALFVAYAPPGVARELVEGHLTEIEATIHLVSPTAETVANLTVTADGDGEARRPDGE